MESTSGWQRSHSGVANCVLYTLNETLVFSDSWRVSLQVSYRYITVNSYWLCVLKRPLSRPEHRWDDNAKRNIKERGWGSVVWTHRTREYGGSRIFRNVGRFVLETYCEYGGTSSFRNICKFLRDYTALRPPSPQPVIFWLVFIRASVTLEFKFQLHFLRGCSDLQQP